MSDAGADLQAILQASFAQQAEGYTAVLQQAVELAAVCERGESIDDRLHAMLAQLQAIPEQQAGLAAIKRQWEDMGRPTDAGLRRMMDRVAALIRQVSRQIQIIEAAARRRRDQLAVEIDVCNRQRQMQRAYLTNQRKS
jgi:hypothetical protein